MINFIYLSIYIFNYFLNLNWSINVGRVTNEPVIGIHNTEYRACGWVWYDVCKQARGGVKGCDIAN